MTVKWTRRPLILLPTGWATFLLVHSLVIVAAGLFARFGLMRSRAIFLALATIDVLAVITGLVLVALGTWQITRRLQKPAVRILVVVPVVALQVIAGAYAFVLLAFALGIWSSGDTI